MSSTTITDTTCHAKGHQAELDLFRSSVDRGTKSLPAQSQYVDWRAVLSQRPNSRSLEGGSGREDCGNLLFKVGIRELRHFFSLKTTSVGSPVGAAGSTELTGDGIIQSTVEYVFVYDEKDLAATSLRSSTDTAQPAKSNAPATATATATSEASTQPNSGLSSGAEAGIGVAVALAVLALMGATVFFFLRRRKRNGRREAEIGDSLQELDGNDYNRLELQGTTKPSELPVHQDEPAELSAEHGNTEMEGS
ncbi:MAG: hypothetical protein M1821_005189 [Bathelium mastoideum]|nr:MAG: hypothetical protein M1821_005189 [Bathelium mastoideum]